MEMAVCNKNCTVKLLGRESTERPEDWDTHLLRFGLIDCGY